MHREEHFNRNIIFLLTYLNHNARLEVDLRFNSKSEFDIFRLSPANSYKRTLTYSVQRSFTVQAPFEYDQKARKKGSNFYY